MKSNKRSLPTPSIGDVITALKQQLEYVQNTSQAQMITLGTPDASSVVKIGIIAAAKCPAYMYDPKVSLPEEWLVMDRKEFVAGLPHPWGAMGVDLIDAVIDTITQCGTVGEFRFMSSATYRARNYFIGTAQLTCFLHSDLRGEVKHVK